MKSFSFAALALAAMTLAGCCCGGGACNPYGCGYGSSCPGGACGVGGPQVVPGAFYQGYNSQAMVTSNYGQVAAMPVNYSSPVMTQTAMVPVESLATW